MNVLFLSESFYPHGSGGELATYLYAKLLSGAGVNVVVVTNRFSGEPDFSNSEGFAVYRLPMFRDEKSLKYSVLKRVDVLLSVSMRKLVRWANVVYIPKFWYSAILLAKKHQKPVIVHLHDYIPICPLAGLYDASQEKVCDRNNPICSKCIYVYEKTQGRHTTETLTSITLNSTLGGCYNKLVRICDAVLCVSKIQRNIIIEREPSLSGKTYVVYNPLPKISNVEVRGDDFGYFGGSNYLKGFKVLYDAVKLINSTNSELTKVFATKFFYSSEQQTSALKKIGILPYGKLDSHEFKKIYEQVRAVIVPSIWPEPWPYVVVEAIIGGRVVVASRIGGIPEQVEGCKNALLFEPGISEQLSEAVKYVKSLDRERTVELGLRSKEAFLKKYSDENSIKKLINILESLQ